ncbi:MAG: SDR family oxidoreductase [Pseudomonadota bacterium]
MNIRNSTIVLTGATGGIGSQLAQEFAEAGARLILVGRQQAPLDALLNALPVKATAPHLTLAVDLLEAAGRQKLRDLCARQDVDLLINNAGTSDFNLLGNADPVIVARQLELNLMVPVLLTQQLLPLLRRRPTSAVVNIGSAFGSIGYPGYAAYCASKFGLRGFSEALRRELADTGVRVLHVAPRATRTALNNARVVAMNAALGNAMDDPRQVARFVVQRVRNERWGHCVIGWPERFYAWINALLPAMTDGSVRKQLPVIRKFADANSRGEN